MVIITACSHIAPSCHKQPGHILLHQPCVQATGNFVVTITEERKKKEKEKTAYDVGFYALSQIFWLIFQLHSSRLERKTIRASKA